ncbi:MAG: MerR family transcriptional regulator [Actinomycetota bacterium]
MDEDTSTTHRTYKTSEVARELGISAEWLRKGEEWGFFPLARRDPRSGHRYYTRSDIERLHNRHAERTGDGR